MSEESLSQLERRIGRIFKIGVVVSTGLMTMGLVLWFAGAAAAPLVLNTGLAVLIAIPISRIVVSFVDALRRRDRLMAGATATVLVILAATIAYSLLVSTT
jgi:uncharacterized membrane protein